MTRIKSYLLSLAVCAFTATAQTTDTNTPEDLSSYPESMTKDLGTMLNEWHAKSYIFPDTTCANPNFNPTFAPEVYQDRLSRIPAVMEMPYNEVVQKYIDRYSGPMRKTVAFMLGAGNFYIPLFEEALDFYGLPLELKYLPVIESALDPTAVSHAGATGLWQLMLTTGKQYDLKVNSLVDERKDPIKSTWAAAKCLRDLYKIYGDWNLVIAAYNCGPGNVNKAIHRANGSRDYWEIYPYLPKETRGYVPAFIAANYIMNYYCEHNICPMKTKLPVTTDTVMLSRNVHMEQIAAVIDIDIEAIKALNPQYRTSLIPGHSEPCALSLPHDKILLFIDLQDSICNYKANELLTRRNNVPLKEVKTEAKAPKSKETTSKKKEAKTVKTKNAKKQKEATKKGKNKKGKTSRKNKTATVKKGETLSSIAAKNGTTVSKLKKLNGLKGDKLKPGQKLKVK